MIERTNTNKVFSEAIDDTIIRIIDNRIKVKERNKMSTELPYCITTNDDIIARFKHESDRDYTLDMLINMYEDCTFIATYDE